MATATKTTAKVDYSLLVVKSTAAPGVLGSIGVTTRGLKDGLTVAVGVGMCIVGLVAIFEGTKLGKSVTSAAETVAKVAVLK